MNYELAQAFWLGWMAASGFAFVAAVADYCWRHR